MATIYDAIQALPADVQQQLSESSVLQREFVAELNRTNGNAAEAAGAFMATLSGIRALGATDYHNTDTFQACYGAGIRDLYEVYHIEPGTAEYAVRLGILEADCLAKAKANAAAPPPSSSNISQIQTQINAILAKYEYCPITVDGKIGPVTCAAARWAVGQGELATVPNSCQGIASDGNWLKDCPKDKPPTEPPAPSGPPAPAEPPAPTTPPGGGGGGGGGTEEKSLFVPILLGVAAGVGALYLVSQSGKSSPRRARARGRSRA